MTRTRQRETIDYLLDLEVVSAALDDLLVSLETKDEETIRIATEKAQTVLDARGRLPTFSRK